MTAQKVGECTFAKRNVCPYKGVGCDNVTQKSCQQATLINMAYVSECPAIPGGKCDIPRYRALLPMGCSCGSESGCNVPREFIPAHDYEISGIFQQKTRPSLSIHEIKSLFARCGLQ